MRVKTGRLVRSFSHVPRGRGQDRLRSSHLIYCQDQPSEERQIGAWVERPTWIEVDLSAIANNTRLIQSRVGPRVSVLACLKADAYGHGAVNVARTVLRHGAKRIGALLSFMLAFLAAVVIALPYAELACRYPLAGGGYAFVQAVLGRHWGFVMGWVYAGSWLFIGGYVSLGFGHYLQQLFFGKDPRVLPGMLPIIGALSLIVGVVLVNLAGGRFFGRVQKGIVLLAVVTLIGYGGASLYCAATGFHGADISRFSFSLPSGISGILEVTPLAFLALAGFDMVAAAGEEVEKPKRTLPLAILLTLGIVLLLYLLVTAATAGALPRSALGSLSPLSDAADRLFGRPGQQLIALAAAFTTAATVNAVLVTTSRITFAMARDGLLPRFLAQVHSSTHVPRVAILINGALLALLALSALSDSEIVLLLAAAGSFLYVLQFVFPLAALVVLRRRSKMVPSFRTPAPYLVLPLAFGGCLLLLCASGQGGIGIGLGWLTGGLVTYAGTQGLMTYLRRKHSLKKGYGATPEQEPRNPYKGLRTFTADDAGDFFGRDRLVDALVKDIKGMLTAEQPSPDNGRLLTIIGPSGFGKSSVVMAGLLPDLQHGALPGSEAWVYLEPMVPGKHPIEALALTFKPHFPDTSFKTLGEDLEDDATRGLHLQATQLVKQRGSRVVLLVDQFEDLFTQTESEDERQRFIDLLLTASTEPRGPLLVLLTLRADFYDRLLQYSELYRLIKVRQKPLFPMEVQDLRATIEHPAALSDVQLTFEGNLVGDLLFEMQGQMGALPILQFTLEQLFQRRSGHQLTLQAYREIGGVKGALSQHAEQTYAALPSEEHCRLARALFVLLIDPGASEQDTTRRRAALSEFTLDDATQTCLLRETIAAFIAARLLTTNEIAGTTTIEVSHEAVIRECVTKCKVASVPFLRGASQAAYQVVPVLPTRRRKLTTEGEICHESSHQN